MGFKQSFHLEVVNMRAIQLAMPLAMVALWVFCASVRAQDDTAKMVDNPQFHAWEKFGVDSSETMSGQIQTGQPQMPTIPMEINYKLAAKAADHLTLETTSTMTVMGQSHTTPAQKTEIAPKVKDQNIQSLGSEKVEAAGRTFDCKVYEMEGKVTPTSPGPGGAAQKPGKAKIWVSDEIPGGMVKMEVTSPRGNLTLTLKSFEKK
jgi:hypothetical protein